MRSDTILRRRIEQIKNPSIGELPPWTSRAEVAPLVHKTTERFGAGFENIGGTEKTGGLSLNDLVDGVKAALGNGFGSLHLIEA